MKRWTLAWLAASLAALCCAAWADALSEDISGTYSFLKDGEVVQVNVENGKLDGWISRFGEQESDRGAEIDQFFDEASLEGSRIRFTTKTVHAVRYEFHGSVGRGPGKTRAQEGYFVIRGTLKQYTTDTDGKESAREREVEFKLLPIEGESDAPPSGKKSD